MGLLSSANCRKWNPKKLTRADHTSAFRSNRPAVLSGGLFCFPARPVYTPVQMVTGGKTDKQQPDAAAARLSGARAGLEKNRALPGEEVESLRAEIGKKDRLIISLLESYPGAAMLADPEGNVTRKNGNAAQLFAGQNLATAVGADVWRRACSGAAPARGLATPDGTMRLAVIPAGGTAGGDLLVLLEDGMERDSCHEQRMQSLGETAAAVAHEIRNPLGSMELFASLLERRLAGEEERALLQKIRNGLADLEKTVSAFLAFAAPAQPAPAPVELSGAVRELFGFLEPSARIASVSLSAGVPPELFVMADAMMLNRLFLNLALNAFQAMPEGGSISVRARPEGEGVLVEFADTGRGMPPETARRAFDPFFTTRENGTGLGLSIVHNIVAAHGGKISVNSAPGAGTVFKLWLKGI